MIIFITASIKKIQKKQKTIKSYRFIDSDRFSEEIEGGRDGEQDKEVYIDHGTLIMEVMNDHTILYV